LKFKTPTSSFKNFLGIIPAGMPEFRQCENNWRFYCNGFCKGLYSDTTVPKFNIEIASNNASLNILTPKTVENIVIDTKIINETGILNDTYVNLENFLSD
jgi:hypothetical protein